MAELKELIEKYLPQILEHRRQDRKSTRLNSSHD